MASVFRPMILLALLASLLFSPMAWAQSKPFDHSTFNDVLSRYVNPSGEVDYRALKEDPEGLNLYLLQLQSLDLVQVAAWPREEQLALWLNAYHAGLLKIIVDHYPITSVQDIPSVWDHRFIQVGDAAFSLNGIRESRLMGAFRDEKIHAALSCGARSCPRLLQESFAGPRVEGQLYLAAREFVNNDEHVTILPEKKKAELSKIFKWYSRDFHLDFGHADNEIHFTPEEYAVLSFIAYYLDHAEKILFLEEGVYKVKYRSFDWSLNDWVQTTEAQAGAL